MEARSAVHDDVEYMRGGCRVESASSILRSTSKYLNSPLFREFFCNEALRLSGPDMLTTSLVPDFYAASDPLLDRQGIAGWIQEDAARLPEFRVWLDARRTGNITPEQVRESPPNTLGRGVKILFDAGFKLYFGRLGEAEDDFDYIHQRRSQTHDLEHIVTGCPTSLLGEIVLSVANIVGAFRYFQPQLARDLVLVQNYLLSARIMRVTLHYPQALLMTLEAIERGKKLGESLRRPFFLEPVEDWLDRPLPEIRSYLGIPDPNYGEDWNWSEPEGIEFQAPLSQVTQD
jgi:ubiquinone biosynthesis protein COQ4